MASDSSSTYLFNHLDLPSLYYHTNNENGGILDLGLSLKVLQPQTYNDSQNSNDDYHDLVEWNQLHRFENPDIGVIDPRKTDNNVINERNTLQRREQQSVFVKVNMDGVLIGRKICVLDHSSYLSLATQLEDMFGKQLLCGLRLFESSSEFALWYKDRGEQWRIVGDVPWNEFVEDVKRIRIMAARDETLFRSSTTMA